MLDTPIEYLKGVGPQRGEVLKKELGIFFFKDLLYHFPFRYVDRSEYDKVVEIPDKEGAVNLRGTLSSIKESGVGRGKRLTARFSDGTGYIELVWFKGANWVKPKLNTEATFVVYGRASKYGAKWNMAHPEIEVSENFNEGRRIQPVYPSGEKLSAKGLNSKGIEKLIGNLLEQVEGKIPENLDEVILQRNHLLRINQAMKQIHQPESLETAEKARLRFKFEELFFLQLEMNFRKTTIQQKHKGFVFEKVGDHFTHFYEKELPFELTNAQKRVIREIRKDLGSGIQMNRLLQGDVGCGKTLVGLLVMLLAVDNGFQACMVAPTEILATQHFQTISEFLEQLDVKVALLTGSTKTAERRALHQQLEEGSLDILIGTHAVFEDKVKFKNLGLAIIDEQHRFGVAQRSKLWKKNKTLPHILVMTATPIPRTLAMTFYGDLEVSVIDELPPGRKPVQTFHYFEKSRLKVFGFIEKEIAKGRQVYIVYPLIEESEKLDYKNLQEGFEAVERYFPKPNYQVSIVHGKMKNADKDYEMNRFVEGKTHIMVATTVIEVGVNVPNASVMIIESAEKFGLSQLHQLRGRVGRGAEESYCILMTGNKISKDAEVRLETMCRTNDGFEIAEVDLKLRGPGDIMGTKQSGLLNLKIADLVKDNQIIALARVEAQEILKEDSGLDLAKHQIVKKELNQILRSRPNWGIIS
ncbi:MAG: ATP-dependent DNA helicase RecG [Crocinitomicaceae bacterium]|nr:ATP-dependent DNA helicase RecG [Crocinitomicaceae bacterium]